MAKKARKARRRAKPAPVLQALLLADEVYQDKRTGKMVIAGTFNVLSTLNFPARLGRETKAYLNLTNCHESVEIQLRYVDLRDNSVLMRSPKIEVKQIDPLRNHEVVISVPPFPMPHAGYYAFEAYCNQRLLGAIRIGVAQLQTPGEGKK